MEVNNRRFQDALHHIDGRIAEVKKITQELMDLKMEFIRTIKEDENVDKEVGSKDSTKESSK